MYQQLHQYIGRCTPIAGEDLAYIDSLLEYKRYPKKTMLLQEGEICNFEAYVLKGCIRSYFVDEKGVEFTLQFAVEDWWVSDIASFHDRLPSQLFIETLEDCELLLLHPDTKERLLARIPALEKMFRLMLQRNLSVLQSRLFSTIATDATQKYLAFIERYPDIPQRVAQHYIASYLGISPEFLSKIRTRLAKK